MKISPGFHDLDIKSQSSHEGQRGKNVYKYFEEHTGGDALPESEFL